MGAIFKNNIKYSSIASRSLGAMIMRGFVDSASELPTEAETGDTFFVGTSAPYFLYIYANDSWNQVQIDTSNFVTLNGDQTITGNKTFSGTTSASTVSASNVTASTVKVVDKLTIPTKAPTNPVYGDFWVE